MSLTPEYLATDLYELSARESFVFLANMALAADKPEFLRPGAGHEPWKSGEIGLQTIDFVRLNTHVRYVEGALFAVDGGDTTQPIFSTTPDHIVEDDFSLMIRDAFATALFDSLPVETEHVILAKSAVEHVRRIVHGQEEPKTSAGFINKAADKPSMFGKAADISIPKRRYL